MRLTVTTRFALVMTCVVFGLVAGNEALAQARGCSCKCKIAVLSDGCLPTLVRIHVTGMSDYNGLCAKFTDGEDKWTGTCQSQQRCQCCDGCWAWFRVVKTEDSGIPYVYDRCRTVIVNGRRCCVRSRRPGDGMEVTVTNGGGEKTEAGEPEEVIIIPL